VQLRSESQFIIAIYRDVHGILHTWSLGVLVSNEQGILRDTRPRAILLSG
jgi:hypothetical protein